MSQEFLESYKKVHLIGIGGIGVSSLARILSSYGLEITGSDLVASEVTENLEKLGIKIFIGEHKKENISKDIDLVAYTVATPRDNPELLQAKALGIRTLSYPQLLGKLTLDKFSICISGTHGKTTTTSMISLILDQAGLDPTCIIGSTLKEFNGNARVGKSKYFVIEADEYRRAFLNYHPNIIVLTSLEFEHPDCFKDLEDLVKTFIQYIQKIPKNGVLVVNADDKNLMKITKQAPCKIVSYGIKNEKADFIGRNIELEKGLPRFDILTQKEKFRPQLKLQIPGIFNVSNALAALACAKELGVSDQVIKKTLFNFKGAWRRFEMIGEKNGITFIDDYAHHPTEVKATLSAARKRFGHRKIICVFQPHHKKRTKVLFNDFIKSFDDVDEIIMPEIYHVAGREDEQDSISSKKLVKELKKRGKKASFKTSLSLVKAYLLEIIERGDVVITMGAGDVTKVGREIVKSLKQE